MRRGYCLVEMSDREHRVYVHNDFHHFMYNVPVTCSYGKAKQFLCLDPGPTEDYALLATRERSHCMAVLQHLKQFLMRCIANALQLNARRMVLGLLESLSRHTTSPLILILQPCKPQSPAPGFFAPILELYEAPVSVEMDTSPTHSTRQQKILAPSERALTLA